jgi:hypothetical protein
MATFKVKTFNELSGKGQNGDIAIIERADINGNQGFTFRDASGWSLPFVQVQTLGANLMTTNTSQSVSAPKTFQGEVVINDDFSVIGATDIDLGFTGEFDITGNDEVGSQFTVSLTETITLTSSDGGTTLGSASGTDFSSIEIEPTSVDITTGNLSVIGATDIDLGFSGNFTIDAGNEASSKVTIDNVEDIELSADAEISINADDISIVADDVSITGTLTVTNSDSESILGIIGTGQGFSHISENATRSANLNCLLDSSGEPSSIMSCNDTSYPAYDDDSVGSQVASSAAGASISFTNYTDTETSAVTVDNFGITLIAPTDKGISFTLATYADNAAAVLGGLAVGKIYKTATGELRIVV